MAKLTFLGATAGVTGSSYLLETDRAKVLLECGLVQGRGDQQSSQRQITRHEQLGQVKRLRRISRRVADNTPRDRLLTATAARIQPC